MTTPLTVARRRGATLITLAMVATLGLMAGAPANAALVATVPLGTSANYSVLGFSTVTNTGPTVLMQSLGLWSGTSITGFGPGVVTPPATTDLTNGAAQQAQSDRMAAYVNAAGRSVDVTTTADLANLTLGGGVHAAASRGALLLNGPLILDGAGDPTTVFIFQTNSTLTTGSGSTVSLINGAQECNVFWQVGSSATLGTGSAFAGNILASASITVTTGTTVRGRALAGAAVTLDTNVFTAPTCAAATPTTTVPGGGTTTTAPGSGTPTTAPGSGTPTSSATPGGPGSPDGPGGPDGPGVPGVVAPPRTGVAPEPSGGGLPWLMWLAPVVFGAAAAGAVLRHRVRLGGAVAGAMRSRPSRQ